MTLIDPDKTTTCIVTETKKTSDHFKFKQTNLLISLMTHVSALQPVFVVFLSAETVGPQRLTQGRFSRFLKAAPPHEGRPACSLFLPAGNLNRFEK